MRSSGLAIAAALALIPTFALARGEIAVVSYEEGVATGGEAFAAGEAAIGIANDHGSGRVVIRLDGMSDRAKACEDPSCFAALGAERGAEFVLAVGVIRGRSNEPLTARFILVLVKDPIERSLEVARASTDVGVAPQEWRPLMEPTLGPILDPIEPTPIMTGRLLVTANVSDAEVLIDGSFVGRTPMPVLDNVPVGRREVTVRAERYEEFSASVEVMENDESRVDATLERLPDSDDTPFYAKPVTWIVAGGVVVAGVVAGVLLLGGGEEKNPHPDAILVPPLR